MTDAPDADLALPRTIARAGDVRPLEPLGLDPDSIAGLAVTTSAHGATTIAEVLERHHARSLIVLHHGRLAYEWHAVEGGDAMANPCFSVTKSFTGTLAATAVHEGRLDRADAVGSLVPALVGSGFGDATVADVADMAASIAYLEEYDDEGGDEGGEAVDGPGTPGPERNGTVEAPFGFADYLVAIGMPPEGLEVDPGAARSIRDLVARMGHGAGPHGEVFTYATPVTDVLAWVLETAESTSYPTLLAERIWAQVGAEHDGQLIVDPTGTPLAGGGLMITTRDLARFGLVLAEGGVGADGSTVVPAPVIEAIRDGGDPEVFGRSPQYGYLTGYSYRDQWWLPGGAGRPLSAWGIYGQLLWVDPAAGLVIACHCGGPDPSDERRDLEQDALCRALTDAAAGWPRA